MKNETRVTGTSLAVRQFVDLISGWMPVHSPSTPFRVEAVVVEERYCLRCYGVRRFDVVIGKPNEFGTTLEAAFCRCCGAEV